MSLDRIQQGRETIAKVMGTQGSDLFEKLGGIAGDFMKEAMGFAFGYCYNRPNLGYRDRELVTMTALVTLGHVPHELKTHINGALNVGITRDEVVETILHLFMYVGAPTMVNALLCAKEVFDQRDADGVKN